MADNRITIALGMRLDQRAMATVTNRIRQFRERTLAASQRLQLLGQQASAAGQTMMSRVSLPLAATGAVIARTAGSFQQSMNILEAKSAASAQQLAALRETAKRLGETTQFSASQAAEGMIELAKAGMSVDQILKSIGPSLDFAVAAQMSLGEVTALTANVLAQFGLDASAAGMVADVLSKGSDSATTSVQDLGEALTYAGSASAAVGVPLEETTALLAAMANTGIRGSMAGTALANAFIKLAKPSNEAQATLKKLGINLADYIDETGKTKRPFADFLKALHEQGAGLADMVSIFEIRAGRALTGIVQDFSKVEAAQNSLAKSQGNAAKQAATVMKGFNGALKSLLSALEGLAIAIADAGFLDWLEGVVEGVTRFVRSLSSLNPSLLRTITVIGGIAAALGPVLGTVGIASKAFGVLGISMATAFGGALLPAVALFGTIAVIWLAVDDLIAFLEGRPSLIGYLLADPDGYIENFKNWLYEVVAYLGWEAKNAARGFGETLHEWLMNDIRRAKELWNWLNKISGLLPGSRGFVGNWARLLGDTFDIKPSGKTAGSAFSEFATTPSPLARLGSGLLGDTNLAPFSPLARQPNIVRQEVSPNISVNVYQPGATTEEIIDVFTRESARIFGEIATPAQPALVQ